MTLTYPIRYVLLCKQVRKSEHKVNLVHSKQLTLRWSDARTCAVNLYINLLLKIDLLLVPQVPNSSSLEASSLAPTAGFVDPPPPEDPHQRQSQAQRGGFAPSAQL